MFIPLCVARSQSANTGMQYLSPYYTSAGEGSWVLGGYYLYYWGGGTPGGGSSSTPAKISSKAQAHGRLDSALDELDSNCFTKLGVSKSTLKQTGRELRFFDGRSNVDGASSIDQTLGPMYNVRRGETFGSVSSTRMAVTLTYLTGGNSRTIVLGSRFWDGDKTAGDQGLTLVHELLHSQFSNLDDVGFARQFAHYTGSSMHDASEAISRWLGDKCN